MITLSSTSGLSSSAATSQLNNKVEALFDRCRLPSAVTVLMVL